MSIPQRCFVVSRKPSTLESALRRIPDMTVLTRSTLKAVLQETTTESVIFILADDYPDRPNTLDAAEWEQLTRHRVYLEYPGFLPGIGEGRPYRASRLERALMVRSSRQKDALAGISTAHTMLYPATEPWVQFGKLAGYDSLAFEVGDTPLKNLVFSIPGRKTLVAATALSNYIHQRLAPTETWRLLWEEIIQWLWDNPQLEFPGEEPLTHASYPAAVPLPKTAGTLAITRSLNWFRAANMLLSASHEEAYRTITEDGFLDDGRFAGGDGTGGVLEGLISEIDSNGRQATRAWRRADCVAEVAGAFAIAAPLTGENRHTAVANNLLDWLYSRSPMTAGDRSDERHPAYGLIGWHDRPRYGRFCHEDGWNIYYGDDNARVVLGSLLASGALQTNRWLPQMIRCLLANLRTTGRHGLRRNAIWHGPLTKNGWQYYRENGELPPEWISPHYQCYLHACWLWLYEQTGERELLEAAVKGLTTLMNAYPNRWRWTNGLQQERARMLLPLAWLVRVAPGEALYRTWLQQMASDLLAFQTSCGALREVLAEGNGKYGPPKCHADYGTREASLLQNDGDPVADMLYTCNFAFLGLHEAACATGRSELLQARDRLADFLIRIQMKSPLPAFDGVWFRAFDFHRWEVWASDADGAWGAWCSETGWTQAWITAVLALREQNRSLWEIYQPANAAAICQSEMETLFEPTKRC